MTFIKQTISDLGYLNQKSADGRLRVSNQISLGDYKQHLDNAGGLFNTAEIAGGLATYEGSLTGGTTLTTTASAGDAAIRQSYQWHPYYAGKPLKVELTASRFDVEASVTKRMGYYSSSTVSPYTATLDGMYFENDGTTLRCKVTRAGTDVFDLAQASWLNQDKTTSYDPTDFNFYVIDFLYLGGAIINFSILTENGLILVAQYQHINVDVNTFVKSPNQPVRYEIVSQGAAGTFNHICSDVAVEGTIIRTGAERTYNNGFTATPSLTSDTRYALLGIRQADRRVPVDIRHISVLSGSTDDLLVELYYGGTTVGAPSWGAIPFSNMTGFVGTDLGVAANLVHSGGVRVFSQYMRGEETASPSIQNARRLGSYIDGTYEEAYLCITPTTANATAVGTINWIEFL